uniref:Uncharacterized protein n=1 Tax=Setaria italica TaxID=4555 RepID=K4ANI8_SETIT
MTVEYGAHWKSSNFALLSCISFWMFMMGNL